jgi:long-chain acyl-CoA synthetase
MKELTYKSIPDMFFSQSFKFGERTMVRYKEAGEWKPLSWLEMAERVRLAAQGLLALGVTRGEKIALLSENRPEWYIADLATLSIACHDSPIYATNIPEQVAHVLRDSDCNFAFASNRGQLEKILIAEKEHRPLTNIIMFNADAVTGDDPRIISLDRLYEIGRENGTAEELDSRLASIGPDDLATLIYTSGTTGNPKGVMLSHYNMLYDVEATCNEISEYFSDNDEHLSFLPLTHSLERMIGYYTMLYSGATVNFAESIAKVKENFGEVHPTFSAVVPRIFEKMFAGVMEQRNSKPKVVRKLIDWSLQVGDDYIRTREERKTPGLLLSLKYQIARKVIFDKIYKGLGGRMKFMGCGGAPLAPHIGRFMWAVGIEVYIGYGLTETSPLATLTPLKEVNIDNVGKPLEGVEIKIAGDGEILIRGPIIMKGYHNMPEATAEVIDKDGWFHSGDVGIFNDEGYLKITDRKKDLIITAGGKNIAPQNLENLLKLQRYIDQVCVIGDRQPFCIALIVPDFDILHKLADENGWESAPVALARRPEVHDLIWRNVEEVNRNLPSYESIKKIALIDQPFTEENHMLTPSMKVRRKNVMEHYNDIITKLYASR